MANDKDEDEFQEMMRIIEKKIEKKKIKRKRDRNYRKVVEIEEPLPTEAPINWIQNLNNAREAVNILINNKKMIYDSETNRWLKSLYLGAFNADNVVFTEKLYICNKDRVKMGVFRLSINRFQHLKNFEIIAEAKHKTKVDLPQISRMNCNGIVDLLYRTIYEKRNEYEETDGMVIKRQIVWEKIPKFYKISAKWFNEPEEQNIEKENVYNCKEMANILSESAFMVFLRYIAGTKQNGLYKFHLMFINGEKCPCTLNISKTMLINYYQRPIKVKKFIKTVLCPNGKVQTTIIVMTNVGQIIYQQWSDTDLHLRLDDRALLYMNGKPPFYPENLVPLRVRFYERRELYCYYTDKYYHNLAKYKNYFNEKSDVLHLISFLLKELMLKKPHRVCEFAANYFCELL